MAGDEVVWDVVIGVVEMDVVCVAGGAAVAVDNVV